MKIIHLGKDSSAINSILKEIRDKDIQKNPFLFRKNMEMLGELMAYEISRQLPERKMKVTTPLGQSEMKIPSVKPVIASILRAALPLHMGLLHIFRDAENTFIAAYRKHLPDSDTEFNIQLDYISTPELNDKYLILADPMLATGRSIVDVFGQLLAYGTPSHTHIVSVIAAEAGIEYIKAQLHEHPLTLWTCAIDPELNASYYIVPGLGDAGDLSFGPKLG